MRLTLRVLGLEVLAIEASTEETETDEVDGSGITAATAVGFTPSHGDQRWERGPGDGEL